MRDKFSENRPEVTFVSAASPFAGRRKWLAGQGGGPDGAVVGPAGEAEGVGPSADPGEEMVLGIPGKVGWSDEED